MANVRPAHRSQDGEKLLQIIKRKEDGAAETEVAPALARLVVEYY